MLELIHTGFAPNTYTKALLTLALKSLSLNFGVDTFYCCAVRFWLLQVLRPKHVNRCSLILALKALSFILRVSIVHVVWFGIDVYRVCAKHVNALFVDLGIEFFLVLNLTFAFLGCPAFMYG